MRNERSRNELVIFDAVCNHKFHLPEDDVFYTELFAPFYSEVKVIASPYVVSQLQNSKVENVSFESTGYHRPWFFRNESLKYILRMLSAKVPENAQIFLPVIHEISFLIFWFVRRRNNCVYAVLHNNFSNTKGKGFKKMLKRYLFIHTLGKLETLFVFTEYARNEVLNAFPELDKEKVVTVPLYMAGRKKIIPKMRPPEVLLFLGLGRTEKGKARAIQLITHPDSSNYRFIVGGGSLAPDVVNDIASSQAEVTYQNGYIDDSKYDALLRECAFLVLLYDESYEGKLSGMFCDAISANTPVIVPNYPPFTDYFQMFGDLGIIVDYKDPLWVNKLNTALIQFDYEKFSESCDRARRYHSKDQIRKKMLKHMLNN